MSTEFFKCFSGEKEAKEFEDHEQRGLPVVSTIFQVPVRYLSLWSLQSLVPETLRGLTTKNKTDRIHVGMLQYQCLFLEGYMLAFCSIKIRNYL